jgi:hypothetical protein
VLLKVLLGRSDELDAGELEAAVLEAGDDGANESTLLITHISISILQVTWHC